MKNSFTEYILTYEGPLMSHVAKFVHKILSVKRDVSVWHMYSRCGIAMSENQLEEYTIMHI